MPGSLLLKYRKVYNMSNYKDLSVVQVQSIPNILIRERWLFWGFFGHSIINHNYNLKTIEDDKVVIDHATGLMWHQNGSSTYMSWNQVEKWMMSLNKNGFAGYHDWRLPTVEEAALLLESSKKDDLYLDHIFNNKQQLIWTGDKCGSEAAWIVNFINGYVGWRYFYNGLYIRPVRFMR